MKSGLVRALAVLAAVSLVAGCASRHRAAGLRYASRCIHGVFGPEDLVHDSTGGVDRLLVSCSDRRRRARPGEIMAVDLTTRAPAVLPRRGDPGGPFHPHGICRQTVGGEPRLYVVNHASASHVGPHGIRAYRIETDGLCYLPEASPPSTPVDLTNPNDLCVTPNGVLYVTNRLGLRRSSLLRFDPEDPRWVTVVDGLAFSNGVWVDDTHVFFTTSVDGKLRAMRREPPVDAPTVVAGGLEGADNITEVPGERALLIAGHDSLIRFALHAKFAWLGFRSPSSVYRVSLTKKRAHRVARKQVRRISGASTALQVGDAIYVGQVYGNCITELRPYARGQ